MKSYEILQVGSGTFGCRSSAVGDGATTAQLRGLSGRRPKPVDSEVRVRIQVIVGTTRDGRFSERVARWVMAQLTRRDDLEVARLTLLADDLAWWAAARSVARSGGA